MTREEEFLAHYGEVAEHSPWVAAEAWPRVAAGAGVADAFEAAIREAGPERQLALVRAHPDLAGRAAIAGDLGDASASEQASAGLDRLTPEEYARFGRLNDAYGARFGFPFVICVREHDKASILAAFERRLENAPDEELEMAIDEVVKIVRLRLA